MHHPPPLPISPDFFATCLRPRLADSHKGTYGAAAIIGGDTGMVGALFLAVRASLLIGAGRVFALPICPQPPRLDPHFPELMFRDPAALGTLDFTAMAIGPGLGQSKAAHDLLAQAIAQPNPLVIDADALNLLAIHPALLRRLNKREAPTVLTPHPGEAARLLATDIATIQSDRLAACDQLLARTGAIVVLKGAGTVLAIPKTAAGHLINPTGNPGMAAAGMGDVLTGLLVGLLAQGFPADQATACAVYLHGAAADDCVAKGIGPAGLTASEVAQAARLRYNQMVLQQAVNQPVAA